MKILASAYVIIGPIVRFTQQLKCVLLGLLVSIPMKVFRKELDKSYYETYGTRSTWKKPEDYTDFCHAEKWFV